MTTPRDANPPSYHHYSTDDEVCQDQAAVIDRIDAPGTEFFSPAKALGDCLATEIRKNPHFYLFSPDETTSNRLDAVFDVTARAWDLPEAPWDLPESTSGQVVELLSENVLFATMLGHILAGRPAVMTSYEAFFSIITSQLLQYLKFLAQAAAVPWRPDLPAANLFSTSTCWRQDHNGFTHQSPALISTLLSVPGARVNCLFPVDDVAARAAFGFTMQSKNLVNLVTFNKTELPRWIDSHHARFQLDNGGASIFGFASDDTPEPDFVFTAAGDIPTRESLAALDLLRQDLPELTFRFVGLAALTPGAIGTFDNPLPRSTFDRYFTTDKPIIANFHGYPATLEQILSRYTKRIRLSVHGFTERGSTTTPFEMLSLNHASRFHLAIDVATRLKRFDLVKKYQERLQENTASAHDRGYDIIEA